MGTALATGDAAHVDDRLQSGPPDQRAEFSCFEAAMADGEEAHSGHLRLSAAGWEPLATSVLEYGVFEVASCFTTAEGADRYRSGLADLNRSHCASVDPLRHHRIGQPQLL